MGISLDLLRLSERPRWTKRLNGEAYDLEFLIPSMSELLRESRPSRNTRMKGGIKKKGNQGKH
jgi:hypothetical protein